MANSGSHIRYVEPLAKLVTDALRAAGWSHAEAARHTGLSRSYIGQVANRKKRYSPGRTPSNEKIEGLARIPGLSKQDIATALYQSTGTPMPRPLRVVGDEVSPVRKSVENYVADFPDEYLPGLLQVLIAVRELLAARNRAKR